MPAQYRALWSTPGGGQGFSVFHFRTVGVVLVPQGVADAVRVFFNSLAGLFPNEVTINFEDEVLSLSEAGALVAVFPVSPPPQVVGINAGLYNRAAGVRVDWLTGQIVAGRRFNGRTYLVPTADTVFTSEGLITAGNITSITNAGDALQTNTAAVGPLAVWSRTHAVTHDVIDTSVPAQGAILRGRRD